ncbi:PepSY domain-containing protein [Nocardiopsis composta]
MCTWASRAGSTPSSRRAGCGRSPRAARCSGSPGPAAPTAPAAPAAPDGSAACCCPGAGRAAAGARSACTGRSACGRWPVCCSSPRPGCPGRRMRGEHRRDAHRVRLGDARAVRRGRRGARRPRRGRRGRGRRRSARPRRPCGPRRPGGRRGHAGHGPDSGSAGIGPDEALAAARTAGLDGPVEIGIPDGDGAPYTVAETQRAWPVQQDQVAVDAGDGRVVEELRFADFPLMAKLTNWGIAAHMGLLFGLPNQLLLAAVAAAALALVVLGYRMWWQRRPTRGGAAFGRPIPRGAWRRLTWRARALVAAAAVAVGLLLPLFGASLLAFVLVDTVIARTAEKRRPAA